MNWDAIGAVAELTGAIGVIASLVYLAGQIRDSWEQMSQNTRAVRAAAYQQFQEQLRATMMQALSLPNLEGVVFRGMDDPETLSEQEAARFGWWLIGVFMIYENAHYPYRMGMLDEDRWRIHRSNLQSLLGRQGICEWWTTRRAVVETPEFAVLVSEMLGEKPETASIGP